jgi:hypothetical protein
MDLEEANLEVKAAEGAGPQTFVPRVMTTVQTRQDFGRSAHVDRRRLVLRVGHDRDVKQVDVDQPAQRQQSLAGAVIVPYLTRGAMRQERKGHAGPSAIVDLGDETLHVRISRLEIRRGQEAAGVFSQAERARTDPSEGGPSIVIQVDDDVLPLGDRAGEGPGLDHLAEKATNDRHFPEGCGVAGKRPAGGVDAELGRGAEAALFAGMETTALPRGVHAFLPSDFARTGESSARSLGVMKPYSSASLR